MKKSIFAKVGAAAVVLTLVTASLVGGTFAKYTSTVNGTGTAQAAKWAIAFKEGTNSPDATTERLDFALKNDNTNITTAEGTIAPGATGQIDLSIDGTGSEIGYAYTIEADIASLGSVPIKFYSDAERTDANELKATDNKITLGSDSVELDAVGTPVTKTIYWKWADVEANNAADTTLGEKTAEADRKGTIALTMTATQLVKTPAAP